jgi:hypothetical protein
VPPFCPNHGVKLFQNCRACTKPWTLVSEAMYSSQPTSGARFCRYCGTPAQWLGRADLVAWIAEQVKASADLTVAARVELVAVLDRIKDMEPSNDNGYRGGRGFMILSQRCSPRSSRYAMR